MPDAPLTASRAPLPFDNSYARLPERFYVRQRATPVAAPVLLALNEPLALDLGLDSDRLRSEEGVAWLAGNATPPGAEPLAQAYAGHQFGHLSPQLGDGRALLLGEVIDRHGRRRDLQLKGSGRTPFSRQGDGRAALGPVLREFLVAEAMHALGIPTTRALAAVATGEPVQRERTLPGAVLTRVAASHIRVGTFVWFAIRGDREALALLTDHALRRHYPEAADDPAPALALLRAVVAAQARLVAGWLAVGFVHGVMNTDNVAISGETIDYGPCAFVDAFDPGAVYSQIDTGGRYALGNQPRIAQWNLARFAEALLPLLDPDEDRALDLANEAVAAFGPAFSAAWAARLRAKLGLLRDEEGDPALAGELLEAMAAGGADWTLTWRRLCDAAARPEAAAEVAALFADSAPFRAWEGAWRARLAREGGDPTTRAASMRRANPSIIPRNHRVASVLAAAEAGDLTPFTALRADLADPYADLPADHPDRTPPTPSQQVCTTTCGT